MCTETRSSSQIMIRIRDRNGTSKPIPWILRIKFGCATFEPLIEAYYAPTVVDVELVLLKGGAEVGQEWLE